MQIGVFGLGRMGANIVRRLLKHGHECVVFNRSLDKVKQLVTEGAKRANTLDEFVEQLAAPRVIWLMLPSGIVTEESLLEVAARLSPGDIIIDGGNSYYKDDVRRAQWLHDRSLHYIDVGTSGGIWGLERGYCLMIGGETSIVQKLDPIFASLAPGISSIPRTPGQAQLNSTAELGYLHCGSHGAGHFVKMVHNGIEYALMQSYAEGFDILRNANSPEISESHSYDFNVSEIAEVWRRGSVVGSWLLDLAAIALTENPSLSNYTGYVQDSGEGRWTIMAAIESAVPAEVLSAALYARFRSRQDHTFAEKMLSAMRQQFGGHVEPVVELSP